MALKNSLTQGMYGDIKLFAGTAIPEVAQGISNYLNLPISGRDIIDYPNENIWVRLHNSVRGQDVYLVQNTSPTGPPQFNGAVNLLANTAAGFCRQGDCSDPLPELYPVG